MARHGVSLEKLGRWRTRRKIRTYVERVLLFGGGRYRGIRSYDEEIGTPEQNVPKKCPNGESTGGYASPAGRRCH
jgi:hypothetical protein